LRICRRSNILGYLLAKHLDRGDLAALAGMPPARVEREALVYLERPAGTTPSQATTK
jgi:hypothetical protein